MLLYLDDDSAMPVVIQLLRKEGHDVAIPADLGMTGKQDPAHFLCAIKAGRVLLTHNHDDFKLLHQLVLYIGGHHPGILVVRRDNDASRDLRPKGIVRALHNLITAAVPISDELNVLNHWR